MSVCIRQQLGEHFGQMDECGILGSAVIVASSCQAAMSGCHVGLSCQVVMSGCHVQQFAVPMKTDDDDDTKDCR